MPRDSTVLSLSERIQAKIEQDRQSLDSQTQSALRKHAESLSELSAEGLSTTQADIQKAGKAIRAVLVEQHRQIKQQSQSTTSQVTEALEAATKRLRWALLWPLLSTAALCLLICLATWLYWKATVPWEIVKMGNGLNYLVMKDDWQTCNTPAPRPCRLAE